MSIAQQLIDLNNVKTNIRNSIFSKGIPIDSSTPFNQYSVKINDIVPNPSGEYHLGMGFNSNVYAICFDSSNYAYVGGNYTTFKGLSQNYLVKLDPNGFKDTTFDISNGFNGQVACLLRDSSNHIYVGGSFQTFRGQTQNRLVRLNLDGTKDTTFDVSNGFNSNVSGIYLDSSNLLYVGGQFNTYKNKTQNFLVRLKSDGSVDTSFDVSTYFDNGVASFAMDSSRKLYVGGFFSSYRSEPSSGRLVRINPDTTRDTTFYPNVRFQSGTVQSMVLDSSNYLYISGSFVTYKDLMDSSLYYFLRFRNNGTVDFPAYDVSTSFFSSLSGITANSITLDSSNHIYVGGVFDSYKGKPQKYLVRLDSDSTVDTAFDVSGGPLQAGQIVVNIVALDASNRLYAGGSFAGYKKGKYSYSYTNFIRLLSNADSDTVFS